MRLFTGVIVYTVVTLLDVRQVAALDEQRRRRPFRRDAAAFRGWQGEGEGDDGRGYVVLLSHADG